MRMCMGDRYTGYKNLGDQQRKGVLCIFDSHVCEFGVLGFVTLALHEE